MKVRHIPLIDHGTKAKRVSALVGLFFLFAVTLLSVVLTTYYFYMKEGQRSADNMIGLNASSVQDDASFSKKDLADKDFVVDVELLDLNPFHSQLKLYANITRLRYTVDNGTLLLGSYNAVKLKHSSYFVEKKVEVALANGDPMKYPFDLYTAEVPFAGFYGTKKDFLQYVTNVTTEPLQEFQYAIIARANLQNWKFILKWKKHRQLKGVNLLKIIVLRSTTVKLFSIFVVCLMWFITLGATLITIQVIARNHQMIPWNITLMSSLLFAMPRLRAVQPNIPPVGTIADTVGLFFNMVLISMCQIAMMVMWMLQRPSPDIKKEEEDDDQTVVMGGFDMAE